jgi:hypothetical protein
MTKFSEEIIKAHAIRNRTRGQRLLPLFMAFVFALAIYPSSAHAQITDTLEVNIPFQFHAGNTKLPPGNYSIHMLENSDLKFMEITSADGSTSALFEVHETDSSSPPAKGELIFNKYGNRYFLSKLFDEGNPSGNEVVESAYEKRTSQAAAEAQIHVPTHHHKQQGT